MPPFEHIGLIDEEVDLAGLFGRPFLLWVCKSRYVSLDYDATKVLICSYEIWLTILHT